MSVLNKEEKKWTVEDSKSLKYGLINFTEKKNPKRARTYFKDIHIIHIIRQPHFF